MSSTETLVGNAVAALSDHRHVDILGSRLSGRSRALGYLVDHFRSDGWEVLEVPGRTPPALLPSLDGDRVMIAADDWDLLDHETRALVTSSGAALVTTRAGGKPAADGMHSLTIPPLDADAMRVVLTRVTGVVLDPEDARTLTDLTDGAVGAAIGITAAAQEQGVLAVHDGRGAMSGSWLDAAEPVVKTLLEPLSQVERDALDGIAQHEQGITGLSGAAADELCRLGYLDRTAGDRAVVASTLLRRWFTRT